MRAEKESWLIKREKKEKTTKKEFRRRNVDMSCLRVFEKKVNRVKKKSCLLKGGKKGKERKKV